MSCKTVIVCCSGPTLRADRVLAAAQSTGATVAAISTAVQVVGSIADLWLFVDPPDMSNGRNLNYGLDSGLQYLNDPRLRKIVPEGGKRRLEPGKYPNVTHVPYSTSSVRDTEQGRKPFDGRLPIMRSQHLSLLFALQWLQREGFTEIVLAGVDLRATVEVPRVWGGLTEDLNDAERISVTKSHNVKHDKTLEILRDWSVQAVSAGCQLFNWSPGSRLNQSLPWWPSVPAKETP